MTLCARCFRDRAGGGMVDGVFVCGGCDPRLSAAMRQNHRRNPGARGRP